MSLLNVEEPVIQKQCLACNKWYKDEIGVLQHHGRNALCKKWTSIMCSDDTAIKIQEIHNSDRKLTCSSCHTTYANMGNLNKHLRNNVTCQKLDLYNMFLERLPDIAAPGENLLENQPEWINAQAQAPPPSTSKLVHIIWNLLLTDKTQIHNLEAEILENNIKEIIAILPSKGGIESETIPQSVKTIYIEYGDTHDTVITDETLVQYEQCYLDIMGFQKSRDNVLVFCNNGYQRSLPFLCHYLIKHHSDEVPNVDIALDIILSQVDSTNYMDVKEDTKEKLQVLTHEDGSPLFP